jgi:zinc protease
VSVDSNREAPRIEVERERFELSCGATLLVHRRPFSAVTAVRVHVRGGPGLDPAGKEGVVHLTGAFADQGTGARTDQDIAALLEPEGGGVSGDAMGLSGAVAGTAWRVLMDVLGELVTDAAYPDALIERQLERMKSRLEVEADDPRAQGGILFKRLVYGEEHFLGRNTYGDLESVSSITPADLRAHRSSNWCGSRLVIAVVGDVDPAEVRDHAEHAFQGVPVGAPHQRTEPSFPPIESRTAAFERERQQVHVHLGHLGIRRAHPDYVPLAVMDHVLGTGPGFTNRITQVLRDQLGLAYSVHADIHGTAGKLPGMFRAYIGTSPEHVRTAVDGFVTEMRRIGEEPVPEEELSVAKSYLVGSFAMGFERASRRAQYLVSAEVHGFPADHLERLPAEFAAVTAEDVRRAAAAHLHPDACSIAVSGPPVEL